MTEINGPLPIVIGMTGHRDLFDEDISRLKMEITKTFEGIKTRYPDTPLTLITSLAEGADTIAAEAALDIGFIDVVVPLPMEKEEYKKDFQSKSSKDGFEQLLKRVKSYFVLTPKHKSSGTDDEYRDMCYEQTGIYIAEHCHILIALWDGVMKDLAGGTSQVVKLKLYGKEGGNTRPDGLGPFYVCPVYHILIRRLCNPNPPGGESSPQYIYPKFYSDEKEQYIFEKNLQQRLDDVLNNINTINRSRLHDE